MDQSSVQQKNRNWARNVWLNDPEIGQSPGMGTSLTPATRVIDPAGNFSLISNGMGAGINNFRDYNSTDNYNYALHQTLITGIHRGSLSGDAHYAVNDHLDIYSNVRYTHQNANNIMAPLGITGASYPSTLPSNIILPTGNPYNIWDKDVDLYKRFSELGDRRFSEAYDTWQVIGGAKGQIVGDWQYDVSMTYGASRSKLQTENMLNYKNLMNELGVSQVNPGDANSPVVYDPSVCVAASGCSLVDPFEPWSGQGLNYIRHTQIDTAMYQMRDFNARVHNNHLVHMPYAHGGDFGIAAGLEHRSEQASYTPDALAANGDLGGGSSYTGGGYNVTEAYIEGRLSLLHDTFLARDLTIDGQGRWSNYSTFGNAYNWKTSINWAPTKDIRFRATLGTSFRAPSISELYGGRGLGYYSGTDPCEAASSYGQYAANVAARCASQGINVATFKNANTGTLPELGGGNPNLSPEISRNYTIGTVITPRWIPGLSIDIDYWHYTIKNMVGTLGGQYILDECYTGQNTAYCSFVGQRSSSGQLTQVDTTNQNVGGLRTSGLDFDLSYHIRIDRQNTISISNNFQQLISYQQQNYAGGPWYNYAGSLFYLGGSSGLPRVRDYATATWTHGDFSMTYMMSYTGGMKYNDGTSNISCEQYVYCSVPGVFSHDLTINYRFGRWNFEAGVNNLLDKKPPFVASGSANTAPGLYASEIMGRYVFLDVGAKF
jgi:outer membrane receptor protein involved in Fe transport